MWKTYAASAEPKPKLRSALGRISSRIQTSSLILRVFSFGGEGEERNWEGAGNPQMHHVHSRSCAVLCVCARASGFFFFSRFVFCFFPTENFSVKLLFQSVTLTSEAMKKSKEKNNEKEGHLTYGTQTLSWGQLFAFHAQMTKLNAVPLWLPLRRWIKPAEQGARLPISSERRRDYF